MKTFRFFSLAVILGCAAFIGSSCRTVTVVTSDGTAYTLRPKFDSTGGYHTVNLGEDLDDVFKATVKGLADLDIKVNDKRSDKLTGLVSGSLADGKKYKVQLEQLTGAVCVKLYIGDFGSNQRVQQIFHAIGERLK